MTLTFDPTVDPNNWIRTASISNSTRFTFQFAKRLGWLTLRYGLRESSGGIGADADFHWWGKSLRLSADLYDATWDQLPRLKVAAAYEVLRHVYVLGGIDDALNTPQTLTVVTGNTDVPIAVRHLPLRPRLLLRRDGPVQRQGPGGAARGRRLGAVERGDRAVAPGSPGYGISALHIVVASAGTPGSGVIGPSPPYCARWAEVRTRAPAISPNTVAPSVGVRA